MPHPGRLLAATSCVVALAGACKADPDLRSGLLAEAAYVEQGVWPRPSHVAAPTAGSFRDVAEPTVARVVAGVAPLPSPEVALASPPAASAPVVSPCDAFTIAYDRAALTDACRTESAARAERLAPLLLATHAASGGRPPSIASADPRVSLGRARAMFLATRDLDVAARVAIADGQAAVALAQCADRLALARDLVWGGLLLDDVTMGTAVELTVTTCAVAASTAPAAALRDLAAAADSVAQGMPPFVEITRRENALMEVRAWGYELEDAQRALLPPTLQGEVRPSEASRDEWRDFRAHAKRVVEAMGRASADERLAAVKALDRKVGGAGPSWGRYLASHDRHVAAIQAFAWSLRARADAEEGKPEPVVPPHLSSATKVDRDGGRLVVTIALDDDDPTRKVTMTFAPTAPP